MHSPLLLLITAAVVATCAIACSSQPPSPPTPDGRARQSVNTPERIAAYVARHNLDTGDSIDGRHGMRPEAAADTPTAKTAPVGSLRLAQPPAPDNSGACACAGANRESKDARMPQAAATLAENEILEVRPRSIVFGIPCAYGKSDCQPSPQLASLLLRAAGKSSRVEIRGRTDAASANAADQALAQRRALGFKRYLVGHGISAASLHTSALAAGGHIADNSLAEGRARNRRVEIETMDLDSPTYRVITSGEQHELD